MQEDIDDFQIAQNSQKLEYYSYVRQVMQAKQLYFWIGNPSVQLLNGTIYLKPAPIFQPQPNKNQDDFQQYLKQYSLFLQAQSFKNYQISKTLLLVGIPNSKNPLQVCQRLNAYLDWIIEIKVIKTNHFRYYGIMILMKDQQKSKQIYKELQTEQYNSLEIQRILVREMSEISYAKADTTRVEGDQFFQTRKKSNIGNQQLMQKILAEQIFISSTKAATNSLNSSMSPRKKQYFLKGIQNSPPHSLIQKQKPTQRSNTNCTICFQQTQGTLISILCSHSFHVKCLMQWKQNICPLCRYHQHPPLIKFCQKCNQCEGLWVCLVCGVRLCCGIQNNILGNDSHIYQHFLQSDHRLSMDLQTKFIFDASQPAFLHQMLYKEVMKNDGNLGIDSSNCNKKGKKTKLSQKISQYQQSISEQMQRQRTYFEENISKQVKNRKQKIKQLKKLISQSESQITELDKHLNEVQIKKEQYQTNSAKLQKELKIIEDVQKYYRNLIEKKTEENKQKQDSQMLQIRRLDEMITLKKQQLKDYKRNKQLSEKIKANIGKDKVQNYIVLGNQKQSKKKKK